MKHGISYRPPDTRSFSELSQAAEKTGLDMLFIPDSQSLYREVYVSSAICAMHTEQIRFGPCVTNPLTRHPAVAASAMGTLSELSNNQAIFGIATGDSAVLNLGLKPSKVDEVRDYLTVFRDLVEKGEGQYRNKSCTLSWFKKKVPTYIAAEGPRTLRLAGEIADGVIIGTGLIPEVISDTLIWIEEGAKKSGRKLDDLDLWWLVDVHMDSDGEKARDEIRTALAATAHHSFSCSPPFRV
jgi:5,10-methylenetetrahydromethanopterin reductase